MQRTPATVFLAGVLLIVGCSGAEQVSAPLIETEGAQDIVLWHVNAVISDNHGHKATLSAAQLEAGRAVSIPFHGNPTHAHTVALSVEDLTRVRDRERVTKESSLDDGHTHFADFKRTDT